MLDGCLMLREGFEVAELAVAWLAIEVGFREFGCSEALVGFVDSFNHYFFVAVAVHVMFEGGLGLKAAIAFYASKVLVMAVEASVLRERLYIRENQAMNRAVAVAD